MSDLHLTLRYRHDAVLAAIDPDGLGGLLGDLDFDDEGNTSADGRYDGGRLVLPSGNRELQLWLYDTWTAPTIDAVAAAAAAADVLEADVTEVHDSGGWITEFRAGQEPRNRDCDGDGNPVLTADTFAELTADLDPAAAVAAVASFFEPLPFTID